ncbi:polysaccharide biosynthesis protein [Flagellimonas sp. 389]|uniref:polysaccharide biosynthesis protein n=1 Tax=Flagellimonas sp. 389 TaxID=2835862 RepID=UPI001BD4EAF4|nr:polysaccharide biosynthesis protein [Flagellimonas sp. 389]MBS9461264.1 polysaccharide biosynthesis protein [Flagellimonas sp. 389]
MFKGKKLLITGGTGSFGNAVLKGLLSSDIEEIRIFSRDEKKQNDMRTQYGNDKIKFYLGDVRDLDSVNTAMKGIHFVFHAAALKQVPSCEFFPLEATKTNVIGTSNVIKAATSNTVERVVCLSTDKAAYPINAMGISKALMEKVAVAESRNIPIGGPIISITRYGNVMASRGSVIPLFFDQIKQSTEITVTDPKMTRFMMSLDEAVDLVLYAFKNGKQGDLFVQKSPASTVEDLANAIQEICNVNVPVKIIGTRHGEKLYETLLTKEEFAKAEDLGGYFKVPADNRDLNYSKYFEKGNESLSQREEYHSHNTKRLTVSEVKKKILELSYLNILDEYRRDK